MIIDRSILTLLLRYIYIYKINKIMGFIYVAPSTMYNFPFLKKYLGYALLSTSVTDESDSSI